MSERSEVWLWNRQSGELAAAALIDEMGEDEVAAAASLWKPCIDARIAALVSEQRPRDDWPEHAHWDWRSKAHHVAGILAYKILGIECAGDVQGLMLIATEGKACQLADQRGKPLVYVHFLATAPWNDPDFVPAPRFGGAGKVLLAAAMQISIESGYRGRIGLHSLPQAIPFYASCGMSDLGEDAGQDGHDLHYFEMTPEQTAEFMARGNR